MERVVSSYRCSFEGSVPDRYKIVLLSFFILQYEFGVVVGTLAIDLQVQSERCVQDVHQTVAFDEEVCLAVRGYYLSGAFNEPGASLFGIRQFYPISVVDFSAVGTVFTLEAATGNRCCDLPGYGLVHG